MADAKQAMNYEIYIQPHLLPEVRPRQDSADPDEQFFIRTHQAFEIWFAQALAELEHARTLLAQPAPAYVPESDMPTIEQHVRRAAAIFDLVSAHLPLLETLKTTSFYNFRRSLFGASGTQSYRFRELEWLMGLLDNDLLDYTRQKLDLEQSLANPEKLDKSKDARHEKSNSTQQSQAPDLPNPVEKEFDTLQKYQSNWNARIDANRQLAPREFAGMAATRDALQRRLLDIQNNGSLREQVFQWLARSTFPGPNGARPATKHGELFAERYEKAYLSAHASDSQVLRALQGMDSAAIKRVNREAQLRTTFFLDAPHRRAIVFLLQFSHLPLLAWPASLVEALLALDQAFANWRDRHIAMVSRVLGGGRISTLGSAGSGLPYLRGTVAKRAFPEIWDARTFMLSHEEAKDIYTERELSSYRFVHEQPQ
jgi:tryptophan 2,3-dioxygenase